MLNVYKPPTFAVHATEQMIYLHIPFVFHNNGKEPIIIKSLQIFFKDDPRPLDFVATVAQLGSTDHKSFATQIVVAPNEAKLVICEFQRRGESFLFREVSWLLDLRAKFVRTNNWMSICKFGIRSSLADPEKVGGGILVYQNED